MSSAQARTLGGLGRVLNSFRIAVVGASVGGLLGFQWSQNKSLQEKVSSLEASAKLAKKSVSAKWGENKPVEHPRKWDYNWDGRCPEFLVKPLKDSASPEAAASRSEKVSELTPSVSKRVILVRHGQYELDGASDEDRRLTDLGREQAKKTGQRLKTLLEQLRTSTSKDENDNHRPLKVRFVKSSMARATETGDLILQELGDDLKAAVLDPEAPPTSCDLIREGAPAEPVPNHPLWTPDASDFFQEGSAIEAGFRRHLKRASHEEKADVVDVLVCHGNVIRYFVCRALQFPPDAWLRFSVNNASITVLNLRPSGRVSVQSIGEAGHLPKEMLTYN